MNKLGDYGTPEMINLHGYPQEKYPTEVSAALRISNPDDPRVAPIPETRLYCYVCKEFKPRDAFHVNVTRRYRQCRDNRCIACKKSKRLSGVLAS